MLTVILADETYAQHAYVAGLPYDGLIKTDNIEIQFLIAETSAGIINYYKNWLADSGPHDHLILSADYGNGGDQLRADDVFDHSLIAVKNDRIVKAVHSMDKIYDDQIPVIENEKVISVQTNEWTCLIGYLKKGLVTETTEKHFKTGVIALLIEEIFNFDLSAAIEDSSFSKRKKKAVLNIKDGLTLKSATGFLKHNYENYNYEIEDVSLAHAILAHLDLNSLAAEQSGLLTCRGADRRTNFIDFNICLEYSVDGTIVTSIEKCKRILAEDESARLVLALEDEAYNPDLLHLLPRLQGLIYNGNRSRHLSILCQQFDVTYLSNPEKQFLFEDGQKVEIRAGNCDPLRDMLLPILMQLSPNASKPELYLNSEDVIPAQNYGLCGIGLLRTEHALTDPNDLQKLRDYFEYTRCEDLDLLQSRYEQRFEENYQRASYSEYQMPITIRLADFIMPELIAINDPSSILQRLKLDNPRGSDFVENYSGFYPMQLRAIRNAYTKILEDANNLAITRILMPMIQNSSEMAGYRQMVKDAFVEMPFQLGAMIETLSGYKNVEDIAKASDFLSIGSNDLTEELLGLTFQNAQGIQNWMTENHTPFNPFIVLSDPILDAVKNIIIRARKANPDIKIGFCGAHAADLQSFIKLLPLGLDYISVPSSAAENCSIARGQWLERQAQNLPDMCYRAPFLTL